MWGSAKSLNNRVSDVKKSVVQNGIFVFAEKVVKMLAYLLTGILLARFAGPEIFGVYSSLLAVGVIFTAISAMGLNNLLIKELFQADQQIVVLINAFALRLKAASVVGLVMIVILLMVLEASVAQSLIAFALVAIATSQIADTFFEVRQNMQKVLLYKSIGYFVGMIVKVYIVINYPSVTLLLVAHLFETIVIFIGAAYFVRSASGVGRRSDLNTAYQYNLFKRATPLLLSSMTCILYMKIDVAMVLRLDSAAAAGVYSAATRLCEALFILSTPIIIATFPQLLALYTADRSEFHDYMRRVFLLLFGAGAVLAVSVWMVSDFVIDLIYGDAYAASADVLMIYAISCPIVFIGDLFSRWLIISDNLILSIQRHLCGLVVNILLNFALIPTYGPVGAAYASVLGYAAAIIAFSLLHQRARGFYDFLRVS